MRATVKPIGPSSYFDQNVAFEISLELKNLKIVFPWKPKILKK